MTERERFPLHDMEYSSEKVKYWQSVACLYVYY